MKPLRSLHCSAVEYSFRSQPELRLPANSYRASAADVIYVDEVRPRASSIT